MSSSLPGSDRRGSIFILIRSLNVGGTERQVVVLARGLAARGYRIVVCTFYDGGVLEPELAGHDVRVVSCRKKSRWDVLPFLFRLTRIIRSERPDIIYSFLNSANVLASLLRPFIPRAKIVWGIRASDMDLSRYDWLARFLYRVECRLSRTADLAISNSEAGVEYAASQGFAKDNIVVVANGVDIRRFRSDADARQRVRQEWDVAETDLLVGTLSRLDPMKDLPTFLRGLALAAGRNPDIRGICIGEGPLEAELKTLAADLGIADRMIWTGRRDDPEAALNGLDIFCSTSRTEGLSNSIVEAMACGLPCVVTDVGDSARIVGDAGWVIPPSEPHDLASALDEAALSDRMASRKARARITDHFSIDALVDNTIAALGRVGHPPPFAP